MSEENPLFRPGPEYHDAIRAVCDRLIPVIQKTARTYGWAAAVHGSKIRDLDILVVPWTHGPSDIPTLLEAVRSAVAIEMDGDCYLINPEGELKPLGRQAYTLTINSDQVVHSPAGAHPFIDMSIVDVRQAVEKVSTELSDLKSRMYKEITQHGRLVGNTLDVKGT